MKVFLDDIRTEYEGWHRTYTVQETIALLETGLVSHLSLDNDLAEYISEKAKLNDDSEILDFDEFKKKFLKAPDNLAEDYVQKYKIQLKARAERLVVLILKEFDAALNKGKLKYSHWLDIPEVICADLIIDNLKSKGFLASKNELGSSGQYINLELVIK